MQGGGGKKCRKLQTVARLYTQYWIIVWIIKPVFYYKLVEEGINKKHYTLRNYSECVRRSTYPFFWVLMLANTYNLFQKNTNSNECQIRITIYAWSFIGI